MVYIEKHMKVGWGDYMVREAIEYTLTEAEKCIRENKLDSEEAANIVFYQNKIIQIILTDAGIEC